MLKIDAAALSLPPTCDNPWFTMSDALTGAGLKAESREEATLDDSRAMERFLAGVECRALRIATLSVGNRDDACDILQDAMLKLVRTYSKRPEAEWRPLFYRILANRITDHQRRQSVRRRVFAWVAPADEEDGTDPLAALPDPRPVAPDQLVGQSDAMAALEVALSRLANRQRQAFLLRNLEGLDVAQTAIAMGCSQGSVKTHYSRAVHSLRDQLGDHWP
ncbi:MAG: RNA polymerase sigma factor [Gammaproteobacteria bacterium]